MGPATERLSEETLERRRQARRLINEINTCPLSAFTRGDLVIIDRIEATMIPEYGAPIAIDIGTLEGIKEQGFRARRAA